MAHFFLLLLTSLAVRAFGDPPNLSRIDRLLDERYSARNQRESNFDPRNYPQDMRQNEVDSDWSRVKSRRHDGDDDYAQIARATRPVPHGRSQDGGVDGKKLVPIPHPIPVLVPLIVSPPYPMQMFPVNFSAMQMRSRPRERVRGHEHVVLMEDRDHEHQADGHGHEHQLEEHGHEHQLDGHGHEHNLEGHDY